MLRIIALYFYPQQEAELIEMKTWDIFCRVIDNYGDIGVCWRLARQVAREHNLEVRLWVDEIAALQHIWPATGPEQQQRLAGVTVCIWREDFQVDYIADVIIEAFACNLPAAYATAIVAIKPAPIWLNLEYLSAESWVEGCHQLGSINPQTGAKKFFYFPGFSEKTGGLLREGELLEQRDDFHRRGQRELFLQGLGVVPATSERLLVSLFSYENTAIESVLHAWSRTSVPVHCLVPVGKTLVSVNSLFETQLGVGDSFSLGSLTLQVIPFVTQVDYDKLLWACDINFVRGEDSFVRAQWAAKPFVWHIYPQDDDAHLIKLEAFLEKYCRSPGSAAIDDPSSAIDEELAEVIRLFWFAWNRGEDCEQHWKRLFERYAEWREYSQIWTRYLGSAPDLATNLVHFCQKLL